MKWPKTHFREFPHCNPHWKQKCGAFIEMLRKKSETLHKGFLYINTTCVNSPSLNSTILHRDTLLNILCCQQSSVNLKYYTPHIHMIHTYDLTHSTWYWILGWCSGRCHIWHWWQPPSQLRSNRIREDPSHAVDLVSCPTRWSLYLPLAICIDQKCTTTEKN